MSFSPWTLHVSAVSVFHNFWALTSRMCSKHIITLSTHCQKDAKGKVANPARGQLEHHVSATIFGTEINSFGPSL